MLKEKKTFYFSKGLAGNEAMIHIKLTSSWHSCDIFSSIEDNAGNAMSQGGHRTYLQGYCRVVLMLSPRNGALRAQAIGKCKFSHSALQQMVNQPSGL